VRYTAWWGPVSLGTRRQRLIGVGGGLLLLIVAVILPAGAVQLAAIDRGMPVDGVSVDSAPSAVPASPLVSQGTVQSGQSMYTLLRNAGVSAAEIVTMQRAVRHVYDVSRLRVGRPYRIELAADGSLRRFRYEIDFARRFEVERQGAGFVGRIDTMASELRERVVQGVIHGSLYDALATQGEAPQIAADLVEIFAWYIDFHTDLRDGDTFRALIEEQYRDGEHVDYRRILAAELVNRQRVLRAVYYASDDDSSAQATRAYYRPDGRAMRRMFLRSPLRYTRISSGFSYRRFHPVLKRYRPHLGIDYAAPRGTAVHSVADGLVKWVGRKGANGNMIKIQHKRGYTTYYLHLSRFARGLRAGKRVTQGQVIGYVGSTGLATGPHLDFRLKRYGKYLNPLRLKKNSASPPLPRRVLPAFQAYAAGTLAKLSQVETAAHQSVP
jgi:murein DD-endopeptidase MepM/ murein hydrolase activator NlpD